MTRPAAASALSYRPEIDGLRALAVLAVMLFHAELSWVNGGFLGVDIFFVISGYLITRLIIAEGRSGTFLLRQFYMRRIRRIMPALLLTLLVVTPIAWFVMVPDQLQNYGQSLVATIGMANNILLLLTRGYWVEPVLFKPLAHSWSLGVEEQFYLLVPPLFALLIAWRKQRLIPALLCVMIAVSFGLMLSAPDEAGFLLLPTRMWELALGGLTALLPPMRSTRLAPGASALSVAGLAAMVLPMTLYNESFAVPSAYALLPVAGCGAFIWAASAQEGAGRLMAWKPAVAIGLVSYSAYLFHQPLFVFIRLLSETQPPPWLMAATIPIILLASWASWHWIERPARRRSAISDLRILAVCGVVAAGLAGTGLWLHRSNGLADHWPSLYGPAGARPVDNSAFNEAADSHIDTVLDPDRRAQNILVVGASFARDFIHMAVMGGDIAPARISYFKQRQCSNRSIRQVRDRAAGAAADTVVIAFDFKRGDIACHQRLVRDLQRAGIAHVRVLGPKRFGWSINPAVLRRRGGAPAQAILRPQENLQINRAARARLPQGTFIDPLSLVGDDQGRVPVFTGQGKLVTQDRRHVTPSGAEWLGQALLADPAFAHLYAGR